MAMGLAALFLSAPPLGAQAQEAASQGPLDTEAFRTTYIRLGLNDGEALLYQPRRKGEDAHIAFVYAHPSGNIFAEPPGAEMATRGHYTIMVNVRGAETGDDAYAPALSQAIRYLRTLPHVRRVVLIGHSGGGHLAAFYQNVAENGPAACSGPEKLYPCDVRKVANLAKPDGLVLLDPTLGAFHQASSLDPAQDETGRKSDTDMFLPINGYDLQQRSARYPDAFIRRFHAAQQARNSAVVDEALARLALIQNGEGRFSDDEPFVVPGMGVTSSGARLYQPDVRLLSHTKGAYPLWKADGSIVTTRLQSTRPAMGGQTIEALGTLEQMTQNSTVRRFLANSAIHMAQDFAITADDIRGVDWASAMNSTPANAQGITVPTLILSMGCHYLLVPDEIIYTHLRAQDKSFAAIEGATHVFTPCKPEYGDSKKRVFDAVAQWAAQPGRF